jgi:DNA-binding transcriptional LysR family regulator
MTTNLRRLDLNLLVFLEALLTERSVTRAAERLELGQPTVSAALARLRRHFSDELLSRVGNSYELTPLARQLVSLTHAAIVSADRVLSSVSVFEPETSQRVFELISSDHGIGAYGPAIIRTIQEKGPDITLRFRPVALDSHRLADDLRLVDGALLPHGNLPGMPHVYLGTDEWVVLNSQGNTQLDGPPTLADLEALPWVVARGTTWTPPPLRQLELLGVSLRIEVETHSFLSVPLLVAGSDRIAIAQYRLVAGLLDSFGLRATPCPFDVVPLVESLWWHPIHKHDSGHVWLREQIQAVGKSLDPA